MNLPCWSVVKKLATVDSEWKEWSDKPGIYIIIRADPINRIFDTDYSGILYIGKAKNLKYRIHQFFRSDHNVSWFLYLNRDLARKYLSVEIADHDTELAKYVGNLDIRYVEATDENHAEHIERVAIFSYLRLFGEVPPLNSSIPDKYRERHEEKEAEAEIKWFVEQSKCNQS